MLESVDPLDSLEVSTQEGVLSWDISEDNCIFLTRTATKMEAASAEGFAAWDRELNSFRSNRCGTINRLLLMIWTARRECIPLVLRR